MRDDVETQRASATQLCDRFGGGKDSLTGVIDVAIVASLTDGTETRDLVRDYGMVIADECHHAASSRYEAVLRETTAKYVCGLTATPIRQDGHHPIIFQQCGSIRHRVDAKTQALARGFVHVLIPRFTQFRKPMSAPDRWHITEIYRALAENTARNELIARDAASALSDGRTPLVLTERVDHAHRLAEMIGRAAEGARVFVLTGQGTAREKAAALAELRSVRSDERMIVVATGRYIGEGFDAPRLDTLLIAMPFSWKGTAAQYAGRLHRLYEGKDEVAIFDYVDARVPALERMYHKRLSAYSSLGYSVRPVPLEERIGSIFTGADRMAAFASDIERASKDILIASPRIAAGTTNALREKILLARTNGAVVIVFTRASDKTSALIDALQNMGARVIQREDLTKRFAVIDRRIVWYGGIDLLGRARADESVMRLENEEIAAELSSMT